MEYDYDGYDSGLQPEGEYQYHDESEEDEDVEVSMSLEQMLLLCVRPTLAQTISSLSFLIVWNVVFRVSSRVSYVPASLQHLLSLLCGLLALQSLFPTAFLLLIPLPVFSYLPLLLPARRGGCVLVLSAAFLVFCELFWLEPRLWHQIRGPQMILIMKSVSLAFDVDIGTVRSSPNLLQYAGYIFSPGNCVFGPWTSYHDYMGIYQQPLRQPSWHRPYWIVHFLSSAGLSLLFLLLSTCVTQYLLPDTSWKWIMAYRDALSFRCSHYFVSYLSEATLLLSGYTKTCLEDHVTVAKPWLIEMPRSLIQVVVSWNLPMHSWLKIYIFNTTRRLGNFLAVLSTYAVSALLHGLNFQLAAVLLSLGLYSYVEFMLRKKLASIFSACIQARACKDECSHQYRWKHWAVLATNAGFSAVAILHLAYLGVMFDHNDSSESGYSYQHTLTKWAHLDYLSHWVALVSYGAYFLI